MPSMHLYNQTAIRLLRKIDEIPGLSSTELTKFAQASYNTVVDYTRMLSAMGLVRIEKRGPSILYNITANGRQAIRHIDDIDALIAASSPEGVSWSVE